MTDVCSQGRPSKAMVWEIEYPAMQIREHGIVELADPPFQPPSLNEASAPKVKCLSPSDPPGR
jgi:hypothetical protein